MELRATEKIRRNEQLNRTLGHRAEGSGRERAQAAPKEPADQLTLSRQALDFAQERSREMWEAQSRQGRQGRLAGMLEALETEKKKLDGMDEKLKTMNKCQKIAAAIMRGDRVPPEDLRYLIEHDQEGYKLALAMRRGKARTLRSGITKAEREQYRKVAGRPLLWRPPGRPRAGGKHPTPQNELWRKTR